MSLTFNLWPPRHEMVKYYLTPAQQCYLCAYFCKENYIKLSPIAGVFLKPPTGLNTLEDYVPTSPLNIILLPHQYYITLHTRLRLPSSLSSSLFMIKIIYDFFYFLHIQSSNEWSHKHNIRQRVKSVERRILLLISLQPFKYCALPSSALDTFRQTKLHASH
jgi:hypothetical protein